MEEKKIISAEGELRLLANGKKFRQKVELRLLNAKVNRNNWQYLDIEENAKREGTGVADTPILCAYVGEKIGDGHNFKILRDEGGDEVADFRDATAERIVGYIRDISDVRMEIIDGVEWLVATGTIFTWYAKQLVEKLKDTGALSVSIETLIDEMHMDGDVEVFTKYTFLGTTILGEDVAPAVKSANIRALSAIDAKEMRKLTLKVASENEKRANPQKKIIKGVNGKMKVKDVENSFAGFSVLAVNDGDVALLGDDGTLHLSSVEKRGDEIVTGENVEASSVTTLSAGDKNVEVPTDVIIEKLNAKIGELNAALDEQKKATDTALRALEKMQKAEDERRREAVRNAIKNRMKEISENSGGVVNEDDCDDLLTDEKIAEFAALENEKGEFCGAERACKEIDARCMEKILEAGKKTNGESKFCWNSFAKDESGSESEYNPLKI